MNPFTLFEIKEIFLRRIKYPMLAVLRNKLAFQSTVNEQLCNEGDGDLHVKPKYR